MRNFEIILNKENGMDTKKLLDLLRQDARLSNAELAAMLGETEEKAAAEIKRLEGEGIIMGYSAIINEEKVDENGVTAIIELKRNEPAQRRAVCVGAACGAGRRFVYHNSLYSAPLQGKRSYIQRG